MIRQGDVLLVPVDKLPAGSVKRAPRKGRGNVIADGEVTGHAHVLDVATTVLHDVNGEMYVEVLAPTELRHDCPGQTVPDHNPLPLAPGVFKYVPQCEEFAGDIRKVID